jgi:hypothetical protein
MPTGDLMPELRPKTSSKKPVQRGLFAELKSLGERSGSALGGVYALAASAVLARVERLEDLNAERRFRERASGAGSPPRRGPSASGPRQTPSSAK